MRALVTGGAGYIGSQLSYSLIDAGYKVIIIDNLSTGTRSAAPENAIFIEGCASDPKILHLAMEKNNIDVVFHLAASVDNSESLKIPEFYYHNNFEVTKNIATACVNYNIRNLIFASTAAVYGVPTTRLVSENHPANPQTPYGKAKLLSEQFLTSMTSSNLHSASIRFFNAGGSDTAGRTGQRNLKSKNLLTIACEAALGNFETFQVNGDNYDTPDGTCIRDFIHVEDIANAYIKTHQYLMNQSLPSSTIMNCGYGFGYSVHDVVNLVQELTGNFFPVSVTIPRKGDVGEVVADNQLITELTGWKPVYDDLEIILQSALNWHRKLHGNNSL